MTTGHQNIRINPSEEGSTFKKKKKYVSIAKRINILKCFLAFTYRTDIQRYQVFRNTIRLRCSDYRIEFLKIFVSAILFWAHVSSSNTQHAIRQFSDQTVDNSGPAGLRSKTGLKTSSQELVIDLLIMIPTKNNNWSAFFIMILRGFHPLPEAVGTKSPGRHGHCW